MLPTFTVLHTADWHLGIRLCDLERTEEHAAFMTWLNATIAAENVNLLIIAGDIFDSANPPQSALRQWFDFLTALRQKCPECAVVAIAGNHDSAHVLEAARAPLDALGVQVVGEMPSPPEGCLHVFPNKHFPALVVAAVPFLRDRDLRQGGQTGTASEIEEQLRQGIRRIYSACAETARPWREKGAALLAMGHLTASGGTLSHSASERDVHVGNLGAVGTEVFGDAFDYVALGHLHRAQRVADTATIRYSGSPFALSFAESNDIKQVRVLKFTEGELTSQEKHDIPCARALIRLQTTTDSLTSDLAALTLPPSPLPPWLEISFSAASDAATTLLERVRTGLVGRNAIAISIRRMAEKSDLIGGCAPSSLHEMQPADVFESVLTDDTIAEDERISLRLTFRQLMDELESRTAAP